MEIKPLLGTDGQEIPLTDDVVDTSLKLLAAQNYGKVVLPGRLDGEDVYVVAVVVDDEEDAEDDGTTVMPIAVLLNESMLDRIVMPEDITEMPPEIPLEPEHG